MTLDSGDQRNDPRVTSAGSKTARANVFVSYRRDNARYLARAIKEGSLQARRAGYNVFVDVDNIPAGRDFVQEIGGQIADSDALLVVIDEHWVSEEGQRRLQDAEDYVRRELEVALERHVPILPVLTQEASLPRRLPESLRQAFRLNGVTLQNDRWVESIEDLACCVEKLTRERAIEVTPGANQARLELDLPGDSPPDYALAQRAARNAGSIDMTVRELLDLFGRRNLTEKARDRLDETLRDAGLRSQPKVSHLILGDRVRITLENEVPEFRLRARIDADGPVSMAVSDLLREFDKRWFTTGVREEIERRLRYVGLIGDPRLPLVDKGGIVTISRTGPPLTRGEAD